MAGIYFLNYGPNTGFWFTFDLGILIGIGLAATAISIPISIVSKHFPLNKRTIAIGIVTAAGSFGYFVSFRGMDKGVVEILGPYGIATSFTYMMKRISKFQTGYIYHYAFIMLIGIVCLLTMLSLWTSIQTYIFMDNRLLFIYAAVLLFYTRFVSTV